MLAFLFRSEFFKVFGDLDDYFQSRSLIRELTLLFLSIVTKKNAHKLQIIFFP